MKVQKVYFDDMYLYIVDEDGNTQRQSLLLYPHLMTASAIDREKYTSSSVGLHWRELNTDVSFESFGCKPGSTVLMYVD